MLTRESDQTRVRVNPCLIERCDGESSASRFTSKRVLDERSEVMKHRIATPTIIRRNIKSQARSPQQSGTVLTTLGAFDLFGGRLARQT